MAGESPTAIGSPSVDDADAECAAATEDEAKYDSPDMLQRFLAYKKMAKHWRGKAADDTEEEEVDNSPACTKAARRVVRWRWFDFAVGFVIMANAITIGAGLQTGDEVFEHLEIVFVILYTLELVLHFVADGVSCLRDNWVKADLFFVVIGWISAILDWTVFTDKNASNNNVVDQMLLLRTFRLLKCARPLRLLSMFKELWKMCSGLMNSGLTITYTIILIVVMLYIFACLGLELVTLGNMDKADITPEFKAVMDAHFSSLGKTMLTLTQFVAMDSVAAIYTPLVLFDNLTIVFFIMIVLIVSIVLMNLVTAVVVDNAMRMAAEDKESRKVEETEKKTRLVKQVYDLVQQMDGDGSGLIDIYELSRAPTETRKQLCDLLNVSQLIDIYKVLDIDPNEDVEVESFFDHIHNHVSYDGTEATHRMERNLAYMDDRCAGLEKTLHRICLRFGLEGKDRTCYKIVDPVGGDHFQYGAARRRDAQERHAHPARVDEGMEIHDAISVPKSDFEKIREAVAKYSRIITKWPGFDFAVGFIILLNSFTLGYGLQLRCIEDTEADKTAVMETIFLVIFTFELILHFFSDGLEALHSVWIKMDCFFIAFGWLDRIIEAIWTDPVVSPPRWLMLLRTVRLLKCARPLRLIYRFRELWTLVSGLMHSLGTILYTLVLILAILYIFACLGVELITLSSLTTSRPDAWKTLMNVYFKNLWVTMLTLSQFLGMDSVSGIYTDLIKEEPILMGMYFVAIVMIVPVVLMNLITAVVVDNALQQAANDEEQQEKFKVELDREAVKALRKSLRDLDRGNTGIINIQVIKKSTHKVREVLCELLHCEQPEQVFAELNLDPTKNIGTEEFFQAILKYREYDGNHPQRRLERALADGEMRLQRLELVLGAVRDKLMIVQLPPAQQSCMAKPGGTPSIGLNATPPEQEVERSPEALCFPEGKVEGPTPPATPDSAGLATIEGKKKGRKKITRKSCSPRSADEPINGASGT